MTEVTGCALCGATDELSAYDVPPQNVSLSLCGKCRPQVEGGELDTKHWFCLQESAWSQEPEVQVVCWRLLQRLKGETWAADLLDQIYLEEDVLAWAQEGQEEEVEDAGPVIKDSNGTILQEGDSVTVIKDLAVKGAGFTAKRGTLVKNIQFSSDPTHIEGRVNGVAVMLKTEFLKKVA